mmetsp:Transcript_28159/g.46646  ORF Transcript_28159/g.46646 Transcript_28159/m.46646 type:complete len:126 (-) Transcript_28159:161-538(-)
MNVRQLFTRTALLISLVFHAGAFQPIPQRELHSSRTEAMFAKKKPTKVQTAKANHDNKWQPLFERLVQYNQSHDNFAVTDDEELSLWLQEQREQFLGLQKGYKVRLTRKRAAALERIGAIDDELF